MKSRNNGTGGKQCGRGWWKSRGRGRDANAPAGGPRVPNSDEPIDEEYDNDD
jgi:hypothetical protein